LRLLLCKKLLFHEEAFIIFQKQLGLLARS
jgi:hypothetical protein